MSLFYLTSILAHYKVGFHQLHHIFGLNLHELTSVDQNLRQARQNQRYQICQIIHILCVCCLVHATKTVNT